jgi:very-short-patch-repair endonuclease
MATSHDAILERLEVSRRELLDLGGRNRLINTPRTGSRSSRLEIVDELADEVFRRLAVDRRAMTFLPSLETEFEPDKWSEKDSGAPALQIDFEPEAESSPTVEAKTEIGGGSDDWTSSIDLNSSSSSPALPQPEDAAGDDAADDNGEPAARHTDSHLQTSLSDEKLQKRLLKLYYDARTYEEEQGVNILFLAIGFLKWTDAESSDRERFAPLILLPVSLERRSASAKFRLACTDDEVATNLSLQEKLKADFGITLPELPDVSEIVPSEYFATVRQAIAEQAGWEVIENDAVLWFFSFSKFLMYRDLTPELWPASQQLEQHPLLAGLLGDGFGNEPPLVDDSSSIDPVLDPVNLIHIRDADSSQALAIEEVRQGRNLIIQGPPGTGKSQTITNVIATAVREGRRVLFMAEKMAALDVVKRRLDDVGLGDVCLELHSHKASKKLVLDEIARTLELGRPKAPNIASHVEQLRNERDRLNRHVEVMFSDIADSSVTVFAALGDFVRLRALELAPVEIELPECLRWHAKEFSRRTNLVQEVVKHVEQTGVPAEHVWRGLEVETLLPTDIDRLTRRLPGLIERLEQLAQSVAELSDALPGGLTEPPDERTAAQSASLVALARGLIELPDADNSTFLDPVWSQLRSDIDAIVEHGRTLAECRQKLADEVAELAWTTDVASARLAIAAHGASWFRIFNSSYRQGMATLRGILKVPVPQPLGARLELLDTLIEGQRAMQAIEADDNRDRIGRRAFGRLWRGADSDWVALQEICNWERNCQEQGLPECFRDLAGQSLDRDRLTVLVRRVEEDLEPGLSDVDDVFRSLKLNVATAFGGWALLPVSNGTGDTTSATGNTTSATGALETGRSAHPPSPHDVYLSELIKRLRDWHQHPELARQWIDFRLRWLQLFETGLGSLAELLAVGTIPADEALDHFHLAYFETLMRHAFELFPELAAFSGVSHEEARERFQRLDETRIELARLEVAIGHYESLPRRAGDVGEVGILRHEINKKRRHMPLRRLLTEAGRAVQAIKPVFMMSPASIAQFLEPGSISFDLLVVDEASQVQPVDALGAIARVKQFVVVGDSKQLPPTQFFQKMTDDDTAAEGTAVTRDLESILGFCEARNVPQRMLRWHYRSQHHSLIAVSNQEFYDGRLYVIPSPEIDSPDFGVRFHHVADGQFDSGRSATNRIEAEQVADAVLDHARRTPNLSLGVGAFSVAQRDAILDELEVRRRRHDELEEFFSNAHIEPFFVKNLENIQGDERDVIFISVGYAKNADGKLSMNFGPLSRDGGERRLNVLITRARQRCEVFSSIRGDDIDPARAKARGAKSLRLFLTYAETGKLEVAERTTRGFDSPFEQEVARCLAAEGYRIESQVGMAGLFIDLAVVDPACPGRFLIGIECDGASYHSSRWARDRDRLRQSVLESHGWTLHRIWSTDWFHRPEDELRKTIAAIEQARAAQIRDDASRKDAASLLDAEPFDASSIDPEADLDTETDEEPRTLASPIEREVVDTESEPENGHGLSTPYVEANVGPSTSKSFYEFGTTGLERFVIRIVQAEGPVHVEEVTRRVAAHWEIKRVVSKVSDRVLQAIENVIRSRELSRHDDFLSTPDQVIRIRDRSEVSSSSLRKPELIPPSEIRVAILEMVRTHFGVARDEVIPEIARLFGFRSTSPALRDRIDSQIEALLATNQLQESDTALRVSADI